ncbi:MAG: hypothetical protein JWQ08_1675, partial [Deinococcus sp.]|nr:hypothetical protein [Deinococcus sp.]
MCFWTPDMGSTATQAVQHQGLKL